MLCTHIRIESIDISITALGTISVEISRFELYDVRTIAYVQTENDTETRLRIEHTYTHSHTALMVVIMPLFIDYTSKTTFSHF